MQLRFRRALEEVAVAGGTAVGNRVNVLGQPDVLAAWSLRTLSFFQRDRLSFAELVEGSLAAGLVEEVFASVARRNEPEAFVVHQPLDRAVCRSHVVSCQRAADFQRPTPFYCRQACRLIFCLAGLRSAQPLRHSSRRAKTAIVARAKVGPRGGYCCCGDLVTVMSLSTWLSTEYSVNG
jgi:hypothetical protein